MDSSPDLHDRAVRRALTSLLAFWAESGVDAAYADAAVDRTARPASTGPAPPARRPGAPAAARAPDLRASAPGAPDPRADAAGADAAEAPSTEARRRAAEAGDLPALAAAAAGFEGCGLRTAGGRAVFARGPSDPLVVWIGEAPDAQDEAAGLPFQGARGRLTDAALRAAGLADRVLLLNTVFWRPPGDAPPSAADQAACLPFVERAVQLAAPRAVVLAGAGAVRGVLGRTDPILKLHGRFLPWTGPHFGVSAPALPTFDAQVLLARPPAKARAWRDLLALAERVDSPADPS